MKCTSISSVLVSVFVVFFVASCGRRESSDVRKSGAEQPADGTIVLAQVGERRITLAALEAEAARRGGGFIRSAEQRRQLLDELIAFEVLLARAKAAGFDQSPPIQNQIERLIVARFQEQQLAAQPAPAPPTETQLRAFYETHSGQFTTPAELRAGLIFFASSPKATLEKRTDQKQLAVSVLTEAQGADDSAFAVLAQKHSADQATRYRGGDTGWLRADADALPWPAPVVAAAAALAQPGDCAPLVETPGGFYVVRLLARKPAGVRAYAEVKDAIAYQFAQAERERRQQDFLEAMRQGIRIQMHPEHLPQIPATRQAAEATPPAVPKS